MQVVRKRGLRGDSVDTLCRGAENRPRTRERTFARRLQDAVCDPRKERSMASPILYVEMLTVGRRRRYFLLRVGYALLLLMAAWICYESTFHRYGGSPLKDQGQES